MRFLLDVHISTSIAQSLAGAGHDVLRAALTHRDWPDRRPLAFAMDEARIVVTQDSDFSDLVYAHGAAPPPAILYIRCEAEELPLMADRIMDVLDADRLTGHMVVVTPAATRYRPLPE